MSARYIQSKPVAVPSASSTSACYQTGFRQALSSTAVAARETPPPAAPRHCISRRDRAASPPPPREPRRSAARDAACRRTGGRRRSVRRAANRDRAMSSGRADRCSATPRCSTINPRRLSSALGRAFVHIEGPELMPRLVRPKACCSRRRPANTLLSSPSASRLIGPRNVWPLRANDAVPSRRRPRFASRQRASEGQTRFSRWRRRRDPRSSRLPDRLVWARSDAASGVQFMQQPLRAGGQPCN